MTKLFFAIRKRSDLSREAFLEYWRGAHVDLVTKTLRDFGIDLYAHNYTIDSKTNGHLSKRYWGAPPFDGLCNLTIGDVAKYSSFAGTPEGKEANRRILEDERRFLDVSRCTMWLADENVIVDKREPGK